MNSLHETTTSKWKTRIPAIVGCASLALGFGVGAGWSQWAETDTGDALAVHTGRLDVAEDQGDAIWTRTTPGFTSAALYGHLVVPDGGDPAPATNPATLQTMPGDVFDYCLPVSSQVAGNNMAAAFTVIINDPLITQAVADGELAVEYYVATAASSDSPCTNLTQIAPALVDSAGNAVPLPTPGQELSIPGLVPGTVVQSNDYSVVVREYVLGDYAWADDFTDPTNDSYWDGASHTCGTGDDAATCVRTAGMWSAQTISAELVQLRSPEASTN